MSRFFPIRFPGSASLDVKEFFRSAGQLLAFSLAAVGHQSSCVRGAMKSGKFCIGGDVGADQAIFPCVFRFVWVTFITFMPICFGHGPCDFSHCSCMFHGEPPENVGLLKLKSQIHHVFNKQFHLQTVGLIDLAKPGVVSKYDVLALDGSIG